MNGIVATLNPAIKTSGRIATTVAGPHVRFVGNADSRRIASAEQPHKTTPSKPQAARARTAIGTVIESGSRNDPGERILDDYRDGIPLPTGAGEDLYLLTLTTIGTERYHI